MTFEDWMIHRGLSRSTVKKYSEAIQGALSDWAMSAGIIAGPLTALKSVTALQGVSSRVQQLPIFQERNQRGHHMYSSALNKFTEYLSEGSDYDLESDLDQILDDTSISSTERHDIVKCRVGQGTFRQKLISYWRSCAVTGYDDTTLLVASHIKPWRACSNTERLDLFNGLLLTPNLDGVFDCGLITFRETGEILLSPLLTKPYLLGIESSMKVRLVDRHKPFMAFHNQNVFRSK